jgi:amidase/6-aminohexanoate-cyclic-dimer hydrolase
MAIDGFLTRSVRDTAAMLDATAGSDLGAPYYAPPRAAGTFLGVIDRPPRRLRIAVSTRTFDGLPIHPECVAAVEHTARRLEALGHELVPVEHVTEIEPFMRAWTNIVACGSQLTVEARATARGLSIDESEEKVERVTRLAMAHGRTISGAQYLASVETVHSVGRQMARFLEPFDMLLTATLGEPPARVGRFATERTDAWNTFLEYRLEHVLPYSPFTALANGTGQPAVSLPLWWSDAGLPVGSHLMARSGEDHVLLQVSAQLEDAEPWFHRRAAR